MERGDSCLKVQLQLRRVRANGGIIQHATTGEFSEHAMPEALPQTCSELGCTALLGVINGELTTSENPCDLQQRILEGYRQREDPEDF